MTEDLAERTADGWPTRAAVNEVWRAVITGEWSRELAHDWTVPWVEGPAGHWPPCDQVIEGALQSLHGLDLTAAPTAPNLIYHGGPRPYVLSAGEVRRRFGQWQQRCRQHHEPA